MHVSHLTVVLRTGFIAALLTACLTRAAEIRIGIIGTDTSHVPAFARDFNDPKNPNRIVGARIVAAFKGGSPEVDASRTRVDKFAAQIEQQYGVKIVGSIQELLPLVDAVLIESVDGRQHLEQARAVFPSGKPVFIDKPFAGSLKDAMEIVRLARETKTPVFSSSSYRFNAGITKLKSADLGSLRGVIAYGPAHIEPHVPDLFFYAMHSAEGMFTVMGTGCQSVVRVSTKNTDVVTGTWSGGRVGVLYGIRDAASPAHITAFGTKAVVDETRDKAGAYTGLTHEIFKFFQTKVAPVSLEETLEIFTFLEAAEESKRRGGTPVTLAEVIALNSRK